MQELSVLLLIETIGVVLVIAVWLFFMIVVPKYPASQASLAVTEKATGLVAAALSNTLPDQPAQVDRRFGNNLNLYVNGEAFEKIPDADRNDAVEKTGRAWCDNVENPWLARVGVYDLRSGKRLGSHVCALGKLKDAFSKPSSQSGSIAP